MQFSIVIGSHRRDSQSAKVAGFLDALLRENGLADKVVTFDLGEDPLPMWDESVWQEDSDWHCLLAPMAEKLAASDGLIVLAPEYHGMAPPALKNFFMMWNRGELAHKPALIVSVSSGIEGTYPVAELRMSGFKNNRLCYIPEHLIVRDVLNVLNDDGISGTGADLYTRQRSLFALRLLHQYALALRQVRDSGLTFDPAFKNGM